jgi:hypothetical protein
MDSWFFLPFPRAMLGFWNRESGRGEQPGGAKGLRLIQIRFSDAEFCKNVANLSNQFAANANRRFEFHKRSQLFHPRAQGSAFCRRDVRQQSRLFARGF